MFITCTVHFFTGYTTSLVLRLGAGEGLIGLPTLIKFPYYDANMGLQLFPFRTFTLVLAILLTVTVSYVARAVLIRIRPKFDILKCVHPHWNTHRGVYDMTASSNDDILASEKITNSDCQNQSIPFQELE